ncbi:MAG: hypothetical protein NT067_00115 [Candidatus Diapherotrites archaeon]|nr:hypothetical protein [Candidatus Diapherotrites archaeon]
MEKPDFVIVRGEHRNEITAFYLAPQVAVRLRKMGYTVKVETVPREVSMTGFMQNVDPAKRSFSHEREIIKAYEKGRVDWQNGIAERYYGSTIVDFHNDFGAFNEPPPKDGPWKWRGSLELGKKGAFISWSRATTRMGSYTPIEIPAVFKPIKSKAIRDSHFTFQEGIHFRGHHRTDREWSKKLGWTGKEMVQALVETALEIRKGSGRGFREIPTNMAAYRKMKLMVADRIRKERGLPLMKPAKKRLSERWPFSRMRRTAKHK